MLNFRSLYIYIIINSIIPQIPFVLNRIDRNTVQRCNHFLLLLLFFLLTFGTKLMALIIAHRSNICLKDV